MIDDQTAVTPAEEFPRELYMSTGEAARLLGVSSETVRRWAKSGQIASVTTTGGRHLIPRRAIRDALPQPTTGPAPVNAQEV